MSHTPSLGIYGHQTPLLARGTNCVVAATATRALSGSVTTTVQDQSVSSPYTFIGSTPGSVADPANQSTKSSLFSQGAEITATARRVPLNMVVSQPARRYPDPEEQENSAPPPSPTPPPAPVTVDIEQIVKDRMTGTPLLHSLPHPTDVIGNRMRQFRAINNTDGALQKGFTSLYGHDSKYKLLLGNVGGSAKKSSIAPSSVQQLISQAGSMMYGGTPSHPETSGRPTSPLAASEAAFSSRAASPPLPPSPILPPPHHQPRSDPFSDTFRHPSSPPRSEARVSSRNPRFTSVQDFLSRPGWQDVTNSEVNDAPQTYCTPVVTNEDPPSPTPETARCNWLYENDNPKQPRVETPSTCPFDPNRCCLHFQHDEISPVRSRSSLNDEQEDQSNPRERHGRMYDWLHREDDDDPQTFATPQKGHQGSDQAASWLKKPCSSSRPQRIKFSRKKQLASHSFYNVLQGRTSQVQHRYLRPAAMDRDNKPAEGTEN